jgi:Fe-S-cluster-containing hydrogenase component 2
MKRMVTITFKDGKAIIDPSQCNGCGLCTKICKFGAIGKQEA